MKLITKLYLGIGFILLIFSVVTVSYLRQSDQVEANIGKVLIAMDVLRKADNIQKNLIDMETGFRGFLITDKEEFLEPYYQGKKQNAIRFAEIKKRLEDTTEARLLNQIETIEKNWRQDFADLVIVARLKSLKDPSQEKAFDKVMETVVKTGVGKQKMDLIRDKLEEFEKQLADNKTRNIASLNSSLAYTRLISGGLTLLAIFLGIIITYFLGRTIKRRLIAMIRWANRISKGDFETQIKDSRNDELTELSDSLNLMAAKLKAYFTNLTRVNNELDQFAYVVSHDLKAPLRAINNLAEWIDEDITDQNPEIHQNLKLMRGRAQRMENLINGILEYSKVGRKDVTVTSFNVRKLLEEIVDSLAPPPNIKIELPAQAPFLTTEKIFLQQIFTNLISNGIKYNDKPEGKITISATENPYDFEFKVTDNGPGIPQKYHHKVFGVFQTIEARDTRESTGVGLAIVKKILEEKGGTIRVESREKEFTTFIFTWPKANPVKH